MYEDINGIIELQEKNLVTNLNEQQKKNGFVTTPFTIKHLEELISLGGLFVIDNQNIIKGYCIAATWDYFKGRPMFDLMLNRFSLITYKNIKITPDNSFEYGPVCIDIALRGTDAFPKLFAKMKEKMSGKYTIGTTFINKTNERSYQAHTKKVFMDVIDEFDFNNNNFYGLAFLTK
jgi:hypothetical protein